MKPQTLTYDKGNIAMSYQVLALKYRPQTFDAIIGQETTTTTLTNAIQKQRLHHAYLFAGPRGIGKTSLARIFAKALNCEKGPTTEPCQECIACQEITGGRSLDVQEIDGASNTSVDDIRTLRENVKYRPGTGRYRIYIIDEVHMLSKSAFAALLKTLEEPPEHVCFIFATTDLEKIPATILSRVLRFDFRRPNTELLVSHLRKIVTAEKIQIDPEGLLWVARRAEGSIRDALSLLDRVTSFAGKTISTEHVLHALGVSGHHAVFQLLGKILARETEAALTLVQKFYDNGQDLQQLGQELMEAIRNALMYKVLGAAGFCDWGDSERTALKGLAELGDGAELEFLFHLFHRAYRELVQSPLPKVHFEITILRMCTREKRETLSALLEKLEGMREGTSSRVTEKIPPRDESNQASPDRTWQQFIHFVEKKKPSLAPIVAHLKWNGQGNGNIQVSYPDNATYRSLLEDRQKLVSELAKEYFGRELTFVGELAKKTEQDETSTEKRSIVDEAISIFDPQKTQVNTV